ncbi:MAG: tyrosine--tRNA ligase [Candidatus Saccharimonadales bacterium]
MTLSEELKWRGFVNQSTYPDITAVDGKPITFYFGVDPSAPSMQIGNLAMTIMIRHFIAHGHRAVLLVGGATGLIGDPDGKTQERSLKTFEEIEKNKTGIILQYQRIFNDTSFTLVDNYDWFKDMGYIDFLRKVGKHVPMRQMLGRDFIQKRLGESGNGISYAEFSYVLIQAYDFLYLHQQHKVSLQLCGSDQWGNSVAGVDLIRRVTGQEAHIWSAPLIVDKTTGKKFGKSEGGAIWLDAKLTSVYQFYQFWLNVDDAAVGDYLKIYSLLSKSDIDEVMRKFDENRAERFAQKTLAFEVTKLVHGETRAAAAKRVTEVLFGKSSYGNLVEEDFMILEQELLTVQLPSDCLISQAIMSTKLAHTTSEVRRLLSQGAIYINGLPVHEDKTLASAGHIAKRVIIRRGKNLNALIQIVHRS